MSRSRGRFFVIPVQNRDLLPSFIFWWNCTRFTLMNEHRQNVRYFLRSACCKIDEFYNIISSILQNRLFLQNPNKFQQLSIIKMLCMADCLFQWPKNRLLKSYILVAEKSATKFLYTTPYQAAARVLCRRGLSGV